jgi:sugar phosphate isomerase/epimerase
MLQLGCGSQNFRGLNLEDCVRLTAGMGFKYINIGAFNETHPVPPSKILADPQKAGREIRDVCARYEVTPVEFFICSVVIGDGSRVQPNDPDAKRREAMLEAFRKVCACAAEAGLSHIMGVPGEPQANDSPDHGMGISLDTLPRMQEIAKQASVGLTIEPHTGSLLTTPEATLAMLKKLPGMTLSLDYSHYIGAGFKPVDLLPLHKYAKHIHAKPARNGVPKCLFYDGDDYFEPLLKDLLEINWNGIVAMECMYPVPAPGLLEHPAFQSILLAGHLERILRKLQECNYAAR